MNYYYIIIIIFAGIESEHGLENSTAFYMEIKCRIHFTLSNAKVTLGLMPLKAILNSNIPLAWLE